MYEVVVIDDFNGAEYIEDTFNNEVEAKEYAEWLTDCENVFAKVVKIF